ncbi:hypothetical protein BH09GEM1_BH09GEM1_32540 [soil metagenome]
MFNTLLASGPPAKRLSRRGWIISIALHSSVLIALGIITGRAVMPMLEKPKEQHIVFAAVKPPAPKVEPAPEKVHIAPKVKAPPVMKKVVTPLYRPPVPKPQAKVAALAPPAALKISASVPVAAVVSAPIGDIAVKVTEAPMGKVGDEIAKNAAAGDAGKESGNHLDSGKAYTDDQVERAVQPISVPSAVYPESMRGLGTQGAVAIRFIVGTNGRVEPGSFVVIDSPGAAFVDAVKRALLAARYRPAEAGGQSVRQLVEQSFSFKLTR